MTRQASPSLPRENSDASLPETVKNEATEIARSTAEQAGQVTDVMSQQAKAVLSETGHLLERGVDELRGQAREGQQKVADGLRGLADQLHTMSERSETGMASDVVRQVSQRARSAANWLESREPGDLRATSRITGSTALAPVSSRTRRTASPRLDSPRRPIPGMTRRPATRDRRIPASWTAR